MFNKKKPMKKLLIIFALLFMFSCSKEYYYETSSGQTVIFEKNPEYFDEGTCRLIYPTTEKYVSYEINGETITIDNVDYIIDYELKILF